MNCKHHYNNHMPHRCHECEMALVSRGREDTDDERMARLILLQTKQNSVAARLLAGKFLDKK